MDTKNTRFRSLAERFHANDAAQRECTSLHQRFLLHLRMQRFGSNNVPFSLGCRFVFAAADAAAAVTPAGQLDVTFEWLS